MLPQSYMKNVFYKKQKKNTKYKISKLTPNNSRPCQFHFFFLYRISMIIDQMSILTAHVFATSTFHK